MANSIRDNARRKLQSAMDNLDNPVTHLAWFIEQYHEDHPEYAQAAIDIIDILKQLHDQIERIRNEI